MRSGNTTMHTAFASSWNDPATKHNDTLLFAPTQGTRFYHNEEALRLLTISFAFISIQALSNECFHAFHPTKK
jgi:hypothetical protein